MGICTSCIRRRRRRRMRDSPSSSLDLETEPLLCQSPASAEATARERFYSYETRWACTVDALTKHGKLPSQEQASKILVGLSKTLNGLVVDKGRKGSISDEARALLVDLKEAVDALEKWGEEKNYDSKLQTIIHNLRLLSQSSSISDSLYPLLPSLSSSVTLRTIVINTLLLLTYNLTRRVTSVANTVESVAQTVETAMSKADTVVRGVEGIAEGVELVAGGALDGVAASLAAQDGRRGKEKEKNEAVNSVEEGARMVEEGVTKIAGGDGKASEPVVLDESEKRKLVINTLREALMSAHKTHPGDNALATLRTMLALGEGYIQSSTSQPPEQPQRVPSPTFKVRVEPALELEMPSSLRDAFSDPSMDPSNSTSTAETQVPERHVDLDEQERLWRRDLESRILADLKVMLERVAGGRSVDSLVERFKEVVRDIPTRQGEAREDVNGDGSTTVQEDNTTEGDENTQHLLQSTFTALRRAVDDPSYLDQGFTKEMDALAEWWGSLVEENENENKKEGEGPPDLARQQIEKERDNLRIFVNELSSFLGSLEDDKATQRAVHAFERLRDDFKGYLHSPNTNVASAAARMGAQQLHLNVIRDVVGYLVPKVIGNAISFSSRHSDSQSFTLPLPLPRVELKAPQTGVVESVVDMRGMVVDVGVHVDDTGRRTRPWWRFWDRDREEEYWWGDQIRNSRMEDSFYSTASTSPSTGEYFGEEGGDDDDSWFAQLLTPTSVKIQRHEEVVIDFRSSLEDTVDEEVAGRETVDEEIDERTPLLHRSTSATSGTDLEQTNTYKTQIDTSARTTSRAHVTVYGLFVGLPPSPAQQSKLHRRHQIETERRISFENISYYVDYVLWKILGYRDEGIVDLDVTFRGANADSRTGQTGGGVVEMEVEFDLGSSSSGDNDDGPQIKPIRIPSLALTLPSPDILDLDVSLSSTRHSLLTSLLLEPIAIPLAKWVMRKEVERAGGETLRVVLEEAGNRAVLLSQVLGGYGGKGWWDVIMGGNYASQETGSEPGPEGNQIKTDVDVGLRGIDVRISSSSDDQDQSQSEVDAEEEPQIEIAVGVAPQIVDSSKAVPESPVHVDLGHAVGQTAQEVSEDVREEVREVVEDAAVVTGTVRGILKGARGGMKGNGGNGTYRKQVRYQESGSITTREGEESGLGKEAWRSDVFDYW